MTKTIVSIHPITWTRATGDEVIDRVYFTFDGVFKNTPDELYYEDSIYLYDRELDSCVVGTYVSDLNGYMIELEENKEHLKKEFEAKMEYLNECQKQAKELALFNNK